MKWEYQIFRWDVPYAGTIEQQIEEARAKLNEVGILGWELVKFETYSGVYRTDYFSVWKRSMS